MLVNILSQVSFLAIHLFINAVLGTFLQQATPNFFDILFVSLL
jgi:hypothetical protein